MPSGSNITRPEVWPRVDPSIVVTSYHGHLHLTISSIKKITNLYHEVFKKRNKKSS